MERSRARTVATVLVALMAALAGCGGAATGSGGGGDGGGGGSGVSADAAEYEATATAQPQATEVAQSGGSSGDASSSGSIQSRALIRTGRIALEVDDFEETERNLTQLVESRDGFVSDSYQERNRVGEQTYLTGQVVLRVPSERFAATFEDIQTEGEVLQSSTSTEDVTEQLVDIEARLSNLRAQRDRLRTLYEQANDTEAILQVERRLSEVQTEIERLEARQQSLERRVALSTITVEIREDRPDRLGVDEKWYDIGFVGAFLESVEGVIVAIQAGIVLVGYALPYLIVLATPFGLLGGAIAWRRGWRPFGRSETVVSEAPPGAQDVDDEEVTDDRDAGEGASDSRE
ncbi:DUF4349 domain-containing protein [Salinigranum sp. GCM10025319]|uniref:DUF4349 domain-containing protein n=1 Tax=Salinigranum sp. GCM10025319 TaxID=3252687 RepID=UPI00361C8824